MDDNDIREAVELFQHVPYYFAQTAMGVDDGGYASMFDCTTDGDFGGRFANEIGADVMAYVLGRVGSREFAENTPKLFSMEAMQRSFGYRLPDDPSDADFLAGADRVAEATVGHLLDVFPSVDARSLENDRARIRDFILVYMKSEASFAESMSDEQPARP